MTRTTPTVGRLAAAALLLSAGTAAAAPEAYYRVVAKTGDPAPGGSFFTSFSTPAVSETGRVAFRADLSAISNGTGMWSEGATGAGQLELVAREGQAIPGGAPGEFGVFESHTYHPYMNSSGDVAFGSILVGNLFVDGADSGIFRHAGGDLEAIAVSTQFASGASGHFTHILGLMSINDSGQVAFPARFSGFGVNETNDSGVWVATPGDLQIALREGDDVPGIPFVQWGDTLSNAVYINGGGEIALRNRFRIGNDAKWSVWSGPTNALGLRANADLQSPVGLPFVDGGIGFGNMSMNDAGAVGIPQSVEDNDDFQMGLWLWNGGLETIAHETSPAPQGLTYAYVDPAGATLDGEGNAIFMARVEGPGVNAGNDRGIIQRDADGSASFLVREGWQASGMANGVEYTMGVSNMPPIFTNDGRVVFDLRVTGPGINDTNDRGAWITRPAEPPALLIQKGQLLWVDGVPKFVDDFRYRAGSGPESGRRQGASVLGHVGFHVEFTDGTEAVIVAFPTTNCRGDANLDGFVNITDLNIVLFNWGNVGDPGMPGDLNFDGSVDIADTNLVLGNFDSMCLPL